MEERQATTGAVSYIRSQLAAGGDLAHSLLQLPLTDDDVTTFVPQGLLAEEGAHFSQSINLSRGLHLDKRRVVAEIASKWSRQLRRHPTQYAVFETYIVERDLQRRVHLPFPYFVCNSEVYAFCSGLNDTTDRLTQIFKSVRDYPFVGILTSLEPSTPEISTGDLLDISTLDELALRTDVLLVGAYDSESFLVWHRDNS